ncbi:ribose-5-phosphate isomerase [Aestuariimicrobium ganziense]|uniref:ribose-5-phosphate isomerase n=1 Tax=Aestuariimicrobium ganziense TaxID=2773677 RepID=UPI001940629E|nr:ribose-5-phosphate isomerase [Aestuariimicrobium ganziense]
MRVHIGTDHAAFELKNHLVTELRKLGHEVVDHGALEYDDADDYPVFIIPTAEAVAADPESLGIVLGGSGNGENIAANKVKGIRSILAYNTDTARLGRQHNNANVIALGGRMASPEESLAIVQTFLQTRWPDEERHARRIDLLTRYEQTGSLDAS